ncbi:aldehyde dehydrogenase family protein [Blastococcus brunescens]|uniref:Aldehyde dehydrogenase family protein n=1 Tax=Blastococcus brunescens TaxID=1564165 RepID=A0ABZ1AWD8_9ACTN|nr:aldehyde dehydrogenase family protein [Blastococcus sp. BMG 8361]WRL62876.1 aldehyde dehydrogenase family protein [Blastococcus sp. BMG 8361]
MQLRTDLHIGGRWRAGAGDARFPVIDPCDGTTIAQFAVATEQDCVDAVEAADAAGPGWAATRRASGASCCAPCSSCCGPSAPRWRRSSCGRTARRFRTRWVRPTTRSSSSAGSPRKRCASAGTSGSPLRVTSTSS